MKHRSQIAKLQSKMTQRKSQTIKVLNQKLKRRDKQLSKIKAELRKVSATDELTKTRTVEKFAKADQQAAALHCRNCRSARLESSPSVTRRADKRSGE